MRLLKRIFRNLFALLFVVLFLGQSAVAPGNELERVRAYTRMIEFDYVNWTLDALVVKNIQEAVKAPRYMTVEEQRKVVFEYLRLVKSVNSITAEINRVYADPNVKEPALAAADLNTRLRATRGMEESLKPLTEAVLQYQVGTVITGMGLAIGGQPFPPVLYHVTRLPNALIVSPRSAIRQDANISLQPEMTTADDDALEKNVEKNLGVSALVVPVGGVGTYPTMVMSTTDLNWLAEVVSHEWTHNFLTIRPVGALYMASEEMRTINETAANISGKEIGLAVIKRYYPELAPAEAKPADGKPAPPLAEDPNAFHFNREMHKTRVQVDALLAAGKISEAEDYMESRRRFFWDHGYQIRRLNQAYFAFYGAYNDVPGGGAAGQDPVGPAVQALRKKSASLADFLNRIAWVTSFESLKALLRTMP